MVDKQHGSLMEALAAFQAALPEVKKGNTAKIRSDKGNFEYDYADLADVAGTVLPLLAKQGVATYSQKVLLDGRLWLRVAIAFGAEERDTLWPLPNDPKQLLDPKALGSAITYGRRYGLLELSGVHPRGEDDDGDAAQVSARQNRSQGGYDDHYGNGAPPARTEAPRAPLGAVELSATLGTLADPETPLHEAYELALASWKWNLQVDENLQTTIRAVIVERLLDACVAATSRTELRPLYKYLHSLGVMTSDLPVGYWQGDTITIGAWLKELGEILPEETPKENTDV